MREKSGKVFTNPKSLAPLESLYTDSPAFFKLIYASHVGKLDPTVDSGTMLSLGSAVEIY